MWMLKYDGTDISESIDTNKTGGSREFIICHYWYFRTINFWFHQNVCGGCHDITWKYISFNDLVIATIAGNYYRINFAFIAKSEVVDRITNADVMIMIVYNYICNYDYI